MTIKKVGVIGCGFLGLPLAWQLVKEGYLVRGSTTRPEKNQELLRAGVHPFVLKLERHKILGQKTDFFEELDLVVVGVPPKRKKEFQKYYPNMISYLTQCLKKASVGRLIFVSSISVYPASEQIPVYSEEFRTGAKAGGIQDLLEAENRLGNCGLDVTVLRLGGLFGGQRHPVKYLSGKSDLKNPLAPVNLIHRADVVNIISRIMRRKVFGETFNAVYPDHPTREEYYRTVARKMDLSLPEFDHSEPSLGKIIEARKVEKILDFTYARRIW